MGILSGNPKENPLHYGEIYDVWQFSMAAKGCVSMYTTLKAHAGDRDLQKMLEHGIQQAKLEIEECDKILIDNGITPSPALAVKPDAKLEDIPIGARFTDMEIAPMLSADLAAGLVICSQVMGKSIREDINALFAKYHATKAANALKMLRLSKEKGWLVPPPLQIQRPEPVHA